MPITVIPKTGINAVGLPASSLADVEGVFDTVLAQLATTVAAETTRAEAAEALLASRSMQLSWPSAAGAIVANGVYQLALSWLWPDSSITGLTCATANGSFVAAIQIGGVSIGGLGGVLVNSAAAVTTPAGANALALGNELTLLVSDATGSPTDATVQVAFIIR